MFKLDIDVDDGPLSKSAMELQRRHIPFVLLKTATNLAQLVKKGEFSVMRKRLDRPTPTTLNSLFVRPATKGKPAQVWFKDSWTTGIPTANALLLRSLKRRRKWPAISSTNPQAPVSRPVPGRRPRSWLWPR